MSDFIERGKSVRAVIEVTCDALRHAIKTESVNRAVNRAKAQRLISALGELQQQLMDDSHAASFSTICAQCDNLTERAALLLRAARHGRKEASGKLVLSASDVVKIVTRWRAGESFASIAPDYGVSANALSIRTAAARQGLTGGPRPTVTLSPSDVAATVARWQSGENLAAIAQDYGVSTSALVAHTAAARRATTVGPIRCGPRPDVQLSASDLAKAVARWQAGESLAAVAREYGANVGTLAKRTAAARQGKIGGPRLTLSDADIAAATARWLAGESLAAIAPDYGMDAKTLANCTRAVRRGQTGGKSRAGRPPKVVLPDSKKAD